MKMPNRRIIGAMLVAAAALVSFFMTQTVATCALLDFPFAACATVRSAPAAIMLQWSGAPDSVLPSVSYAVCRKDASSNSWGNPIAKLPGSATSYSDVAVRLGDRYEYQVACNITVDATQPPLVKWAYVYSGIEVPAVDSRGKVILVVDSSRSDSLRPELDRLAQDLVGDGWQVVRHDVPPTLKDFEVKAIVKKDYQSDPANVCALFLLGHVAVPYSGDIAPDGHADMRGAWPADVYYGDMTGTWTDTTVDTTGRKLRSPRNVNVPDDGKWDASHLPDDGAVVIGVGRVDLSNLPAFTTADPSLDETALLRRYLDKDHAYRNRMAPFDKIPRRALISIGFGARQRPYLLSPGLASALLGPQSFDVASWLPTISQHSYTWAMGFAVGDYNRVEGVINVQQAATQSINVVFAQLVGSHSGDWDSTDNIVRSMLASQETCLACSWGANWYYHHMALGETLGYSARVTQNNRGFYPNPWGTAFSANTMAMVHFAQQGDPTLRLFPVAPPTQSQIVLRDGKLELVWQASTDSVLGYFIYSAPTAGGPFTRLDKNPVSGTQYTIDNPAGRREVYMVRALKLETTGSGSFYNLSQGAFASAQ